MNKYQSLDSNSRIFGSMQVDVFEHKLCQTHI